MAEEVVKRITDRLWAAKRWRIGKPMLGHLVRMAYDVLMDESRTYDMLDAILDPMLGYEENKRRLDEWLDVVRTLTERVTREADRIAEMEREFMEEEVDWMEREMARMGVPEEMIEHYRRRIEERMRDRIERLERSLIEAIRKAEMGRREAREEMEALSRRYEEELRRAREEARRIREEVGAAKPERPPKAKVLPEVPERCPVCGEPLERIDKVPFGPIPIALTTEEEYLRARTGVPLPEGKVITIDVPPTMRIWMCRNEHIFERDVTGRLVERPPEYIYRKILRELARIHRVEYPAKAEERIAVPRVVKTRELVAMWLRSVKGLSEEEYAKLSEEERKKIMEEFEEWVRKRRWGF